MPVSQRTEAEVNQDTGQETHPPGDECQEAEVEQNHQEEHYDGAKRFFYDHQRHNTIALVVLDKFASHRVTLQKAFGMIRILGAHLGVGHLFHGGGEDPGIGVFIHTQMILPVLGHIVIQDVGVGGEVFQELLHRFQQRFPGDVFIQADHRLGTVQDHIGEELLAQFLDHGVHDEPSSVGRTALQTQEEEACLVFLGQVVDYLLRHVAVDLIVFGSFHFDVSGFQV